MRSQATGSDGTICATATSLGVHSGTVISGSLGPKQGKNTLYFGEYIWLDKAKTYTLYLRADEKMPECSVFFYGSSKDGCLQVEGNNQGFSVHNILPQTFTPDESCYYRPGVYTSRDLDFSDYEMHLFVLEGVYTYDSIRGQVEFNDLNDNFTSMSAVRDSLRCKNLIRTVNYSRTTKHYFDYVAEKTGIKTVNLGVSGTGYMRRKDINRAFYQRVSDIPEDADVITIFGSGNDLSSDQTLGTVTDTGTDTICGCINATIDAIYERIPLARLGIVTPTPWVGNMPSKTTCGMAKYSEAIVEICKRRSIPCLDLYHESNLRPDDENFRKLAFSKDGGNGVHPDEKGHEIIAASFQSLLERLIL